MTAGIPPIITAAITVIFITMDSTFRINEQFRRLIALARFPLAFCFSAYRKEKLLLMAALFPCENYL